MVNIFFEDAALVCHMHHLIYDSPQSGGKTVVLQQRFECLTTKVYAMQTSSRLETDYHFVLSRKCDLRQFASGEQRRIIATQVRDRNAAALQDFSQNPLVNITAADNPSGFGNHFRRMLSSVAF